MQEAQLITQNLEKIIEHLGDVYESVAEITDIKFAKAFKKIQLTDPPLKPQIIFETYSCRSRESNVNAGLRSRVF